MMLEGSGGSSAAPIKQVSLSFDNALTDTGARGLTWSKGGSVTYDSTTKQEGTHSLKRTTAGSNAGFLCTSPASVFDYSKPGTMRLYFANLVKPATTQYILYSNSKGLSLGMLSTGILRASYTPGTGGIVSVDGSTAGDVSANASFQLVELIWNPSTKTFEFKIGGVSQGTSAAAADATPGVTSFDILGDAGTTSTAVAGNVDLFEVYQ